MTRWEAGCERVLSGRELRGDWLLVGHNEPPLGSHLVTPRRGYLHHGIYVGACTVVHYSGLAHGLRRGPVEEIPFAHFACGQRVWVRSEAPSDFNVREVICRARSRVGEDRYRLLTNNWQTVSASANGVCAARLEASRSKPGLHVPDLRCLQHFA